MGDSLRNITEVGSLQNHFVENIGKYQSVPEITTEIVENVLEKLVVYPDRRIEIVWKYQEDIARLARDIGLGGSGTA